MINAVVTAISWCNENSGFFSLILAVIAIWISIAAISSQNKIALFEKRLDIYFEIVDIFSRASRIAELYGTRRKNNSSKNLLQMKHSMAVLMLDIRGAAFELAKRAMNEEEKLIKYKESIKASSPSDKASDAKDVFVNAEYERLETAHDEAVINYYEFCVEHDKRNDIANKVGVFFSVDISDKVKELVGSYEDLKIEFVVFDAEQITQSIRRLEEIVVAFEKGDVLKKMRKKFPV